MLENNWTLSVGNTEITEENITKMLKLMPSKEKEDSVLYKVINHAIEAYKFSPNSIMFYPLNIAEGIFEDLYESFLKREKENELKALMDANFGKGSYDKYKDAFEMHRFGDVGFLQIKDFVPTISKSLKKIKTKTNIYNNKNKPKWMRR